jgi:lycopene cyclase domain-containing protein
MNFYLMLDLIVLAGPLALSFDRRVAFYKKWPAVFSAIGLIVLIYGAWDIWKTASGVWSFNPAYAGEFRFLLLPPAEWLFFVVVPYACIFILACVRAYFKDAELRLPRPLFFAIAAALAALGIALIGRTYTGIVLIAAALTLAASEVLAPKSLRSRNFWLAMAITYVPFLIANGILTGKPVVLYDDTRNLGLRVGTIPVEDFVYSFAMLLLAFVLYDLFSALYERRRQARSAAEGTGA